MSPELRAALVLMHQRRDKVREAEQAIARFLQQQRRNPTLSKAGQAEHRRQLDATKQACLDLYRDARAEVLRLNPAFDIERAIAGRHLIRKAAALLSTLRDEVDDLDAGELALIDELIAYDRQN